MVTDILNVKIPGNSITYAIVSLIKENVLYSKRNKKLNKQ